MFRAKDHFKRHVYKGAISYWISENPMAWLMHQDNFLSEDAGGKDFQEIVLGRNQPVGLVEQNRRRGEAEVSLTAIAMSPDFYNRYGEELGPVGNSVIEIKKDDIVKNMHRLRKSDIFARDTLCVLDESGDPLFFLVEQTYCVFMHVNKNGYAVIGSKQYPKAPPSDPEQIQTGPACDDV
jgi:hypothetical protein